MRGIRWVLISTVLFAVRPNSGASVFHWVTRLGHTECDNRPVAENHSAGLVARGGQKDIEDTDDSLHFEAERPLASHSSLMLVVCNGDVHVLPNPDSGKLKLVVRLGTGLSHELTVRRYLQEFAVEADRADIEWKLPERTHPVFDLYVPKDTALDLQLGKTDLLVKGVRGDKSVNAGKGTVRLAVTHSDLEYRAIVVDVAMGSFADLRFSGKQEHHVPFHTELPGQGSAKVHLQMAMGRVELTPEE